MRRKLPEGGIVKSLTVLTQDNRTMSRDFKPTVVSLLTLTFHSYDHVSKIFSNSLTYTTLMVSPTWSTALRTTEQN
jgi:hypothetical protein